MYGLILREIYYRGGLAYLIVSVPSIASLTFFIAYVKLSPGLALALVSTLTWPVQR